MSATGYADFVDRHWPKMLVALLLTFASGLVDIVGYLGVFHLFTAHLTGTTVQLGHNLAARNWVDMFAAVSIVAAFVGGSVVGRTLIEIASRKRIRRIASATLTIEALLLIAAFGLPSSFTKTPYAGLALLACAMGIQTATLTGIGPLTVHTTFVTGMLNKIAQLISHIGFRAYDLARSQQSGTRRDQRRDIQMAVFLFVIWLFYVAGAIAGTWIFGFWGLSSLLVAVGLLAVGVVADQISPLSIQEEKEQSER